MANRRRIEIARVGKHWMRAHVNTDTVTEERVLSADIPLLGLHPEVVKKIGPYVVWSIDEPSGAEINDAIIAEWASLPPELTGVIEQAAMSGARDAMIQLKRTNSSSANFFPGVNKIAADYASKHAVEWWPEIREPARTKIRRIIKNAFEKKTPFSEVIDDIRKADFFSDARAATIARTEIAQAQVGSNFEVWKKSGLVKSVKWLTVGRDPCLICEANHGQVRKLGEAFQSGQIMPLAHIDCGCILQAVGFADDPE